MRFLASLIFLPVALLSADPEACAESTTSEVEVGVSRSAEGHAVVSIRLPISEEERRMQATFDFGGTKGFLGPSSNPTDQSPITNADKTVIAVSHLPATKSSYVHLFLRSGNGDLTVVNSVNARVARLLKPRWAETAKNFLRVESISGRLITMQTVDFATGAREQFTFVVSVGASGALTLAR